MKISELRQVDWDKTQIRVCLIKWQNGLEALNNPHQSCVPINANYLIFFISKASNGNTIVACNNISMCPPGTVRFIHTSTQSCASNSQHPFIFRSSWYLKGKLFVFRIHKIDYFTNWKKRKRTDWDADWRNWINICGHGIEMTGILWACISEFEQHSINGWASSWHDRTVDLSQDALI